MPRRIAADRRALRLDRLRLPGPEGRFDRVSPPLSGGVVTILAPRTKLEIPERFAKVISFPKKMLRVDGFDPAVIGVTALTPQQLRISAISQGLTNVLVYDEDGDDFDVEVLVTGDARLLQAILNRTYPEHERRRHESPRQRAAPRLGHRTARHQQHRGAGGTVLSHRARSDGRRRPAGSAAARQSHGSPAVVDAEDGAQLRLLQQERRRHQRLPVRSPRSARWPRRSAARRRGRSAISDCRTRSSAVGFADANNAFLGLIDALKQEGLLKLHAKSTLTTRSGEAGPIGKRRRIPDSRAERPGNRHHPMAGVRRDLESLPIVVSPTRLKQQVTIEVSERDTNTAVTLNGTTVPGINRRKVSTQAEMNFGDTLVVGGLIFTRYTAATSKIPFLGELPASARCSAATTTPRRRPNSSC